MAKKKGKKVKLGKFERGVMSRLLDELDDISVALDTFEMEAGDGKRGPFDKEVIELGLLTERLTRMAGFDIQ